MPPLPVHAESFFRSVNASATVYLWSFQRRNEPPQPHSHGPGSQFLTVMGIVAGLLIIVFGLIGLRKLLLVTRAYRAQRRPITPPPMFHRDTRRVPPSIPFDDLTGWGIRPLSHEVAEWFRSRAHGLPRRTVLTMVQRDSDALSVSSRHRLVAGESGLDDAASRTSVGTHEHIPLSVPPPVAHSWPQQVAHP